LLIAIVGAECTGKSSLAQALACHFGGQLVPEYLRSFCTAKGRTPMALEQTLILEAQAALESKALAGQAEPSWIFCDTAPLLTAVYSEHYFSDTSLHARALELHARYALTLLLAPDLPWVPDGLQRDGPSARLAVHALLERAFAPLPSVVRVVGSGAARVSAAINAVQTLTQLQCSPHRGCAPQGALRNTPLT
jgi:nicotinamide riboside kinase